MKTFKHIILLTFCILLYGCENDNNLSSISDTGFSDIQILKKRDASLPTEAKTSPVILGDEPSKSLSDVSICNSSDKLGYSYAVGNSILANAENIKAKVLDIDKILEYDPNYVEDNHPKTFVSERFSYTDYETYESHLSKTGKIETGFSLNLGLFKIGRKHTNEYTFTSDITGSHNVVYGELNMEYRNSSYILNITDGDRKIFAREFLTRTFKQNLFQATIGSILNSYGEFVLTGYVTGGKAFAMYAGEGASNSTSQSRINGLNNDIDASFSWNGNSAGANANFGNNNSNSSSSSFTTSNLYTKLFVWGGTPNNAGLSTATKLESVNINLEPWVQSLSDESKHAIIDVTTNGLYPLSEFVLEENFKRRIDNTALGILPANPRLLLPYIEIGRVFKRYSSSGTALYDIAAILVTRQGDRIILHDASSANATDAQLAQNENANTFTQKASVIAEQKGKYFDLEIRSNPTLRLNPRLGNPLCFDLGVFDEANMRKFTNTNSNIVYLYDTTNHIAFSYFIHPLDGDWILDEYGIRDWEADMLSRSISMATLANRYKIIGL